MNAPPDGNRRHHRSAPFVLAILLGLIVLASGSYLWWVSGAGVESVLPAEQVELQPSARVPEREASELGLGADAVRSPRFEYHGTWSHRPVVGSDTKPVPTTPLVYSLLLLDKQTGLYFAPVFVEADHAEIMFWELIDDRLHKYERALENPEIRAKAKQLAGSGSLVVSEAIVLPDGGGLRLVLRQRLQLASAGRSTTFEKGASAEASWTVHQQP